jgi:hypothetical protein
MEPAAGAVACVAAGHIGGVAALLQEKAFFSRCAARYRAAGFGTPGAAEERSWRNSWPPLFAALVRAGLEDLQVYLEYGTPGGGRRLNALLVGAAPTSALGLVVVELKQWQTCRILDADRVMRSDGNGGRYRDYLTPGRDGGWVYHSTRTYSQSFQYAKPGGGIGSGTMTVTVHNDGGHVSAQVLFKRGPDPKPERKDGSQCTGCWAMGTNPYYDPINGELPDTPKLKTWQKVVVGVVAGLALTVAAAPVIAAVAPGCLATAPVCFAELAEMATSGASGGSALVGSGATAAAAARSAAARGAEARALGLRREEYVAQLVGGTEPFQRGH